MCGFVGYVGNAPPDLLRARHAAGLAPLAARGPDGEGRWQEPGVVLGHRRLSVLDLSDAASQPMVSADGRLVIVHNGEVYNFRELKKHPDLGSARWRGTGDTEVMLAAFQAWGEECVLHFEGMFAFAVWNREERTLFLARDRFGVKPLYYRTGPGWIAFGSRPNAVRAVAGDAALRVDVQAVRDYLDLGFVPSPRSGIEGLHKLPAASTLHWDGARAVVRRYWTPSEPPGLPDGERGALGPSPRLEDVVLQSVSSRLASDVPVGAFLSSGIDSSLVVAAMARLRDRDVDTFTIGFKERQFDESGRAQAIAARLGVRNQTEVLDADDLLALLPRYLEVFDEPYCDASAFAVMAVARMARRSVTVALSGDGGDEMFGGYTFYAIMRWLGLLDHLPGAAGALGIASRALGNQRLGLASEALRVEGGLQRYWFVRSIRKDLPSLLSVDRQASTESSFRVLTALARDIRRDPRDSGYWSEVDKLLVLPDSYLQKVDVASMSYSLEAREPMLSTTVAEYSTRVPGCEKVGLLRSKQLLRGLANRWIGGDLFDRKKRGFTVPIGSWLRGGLREWSRDLVNDASALSALGLDRDVVGRVWSDHDSGRREAGMYVWGLVMLLAWYRTQVSRSGGAA